MGIKGLYAFIKKHAPKAIKIVSQEELQGKPVVVDVSQTIHKYVRAILGSGAKINTKKGKFTAHIMAIINKTIFYARKKISPRYIFDGHSDELKKETLDGRSDIRDKATSEAAQFIFEKWMVKDVKKCLDLMGIPWFQARGEADPECARFTRPSKNSSVSPAYAVVSDDGDMLTYGATRLIRELDSKSNAAVIITLKDVLKELELDMNQFIDLCILMGCDYCPTLPGIGPVSAFKLVKTEPSIRKWAIREGKGRIWVRRFLETRKLFKREELETATTPSVWKRPNFEGLKKYLIKQGFTTPGDKVGVLRTYYLDWKNKNKKTVNNKRSHH
jgi:flap endonuclease-1